MSNYFSKFNQFFRNKIFKPYSLRYEKQRNELFYKYLKPDPNDKILDLGGNDGRRMASLFPEKGKDIYIADISTEGLEAAKTNYGYTTILINESGVLPFGDNYFDIVFCNSVIEHVTTDKADIYDNVTNREFKEKSLRRQRLFADEIRRVGKKYFVQTPNKHFIIESHTWFPSLYVYFPRSVQIKTIQLLGKFWVKKSSPDFNLLTVSDMKSMFPEAIIIREKSLFMTKSIIAIKS